MCFYLGKESRMWVASQHTKADAVVQMIARDQIRFVLVAPNGKPYRLRLNNVQALVFTTGQVSMTMLPEVWDELKYDMNHDREDED
jgi:hypothetical protein